MGIATALARWYWRQAWIPMAWKKQAYKNLAATAQAPDAPFACDFFGLHYRGNLRNGIEFAIYFYGAFEKPLLFFLRDALQSLAVERPVFCDIGANIGQHSLFMSRFAGQVHAFEPLTTVSSRLREHIELNGLHNIAVHDVGLGDANTTLPFFAPTGNNQGVGSFDADSMARGNQPVGELAVARGDDYFARHAIAPVHLLKIDVEGFERQVLAGLTRTLEQQRPIIVLELTYGAANSFPSRQALAAALPEDYRLYVFDTRKADGRTARRRGARTKRSGDYKLIPLQGWRHQDQDDLVVIPAERADTIPLRSQH